MGKKGYLYFISDGKKNIKIGITYNIERRIKQLQTGNAQELELEHYVVLVNMTEAFELETLLHRSMAEYQIKNEWYQKKPVMKMLQHNWIHVGGYKFRGLGYPGWKIGLFALIIFIIAICARQVM